MYASLYARRRIAKPIGRRETGLQCALAGSIFGAKFLERFTDYPWAHLDIAGMAWGEGELPDQAPGATGFGVGLLVAWLRGRRAETTPLLTS